MTMPAMQREQGTPLNGQTAQPARGKRLSPQERSEQNLRLLQQYGSQVLIPRSTESWGLIRMGYPLNKAIAKLRRSVGLPIAGAEGVAGIGPIPGVVKG